ncbi:hypothetical protein [uncultured Campylobacter sp.]|uniref:hypothetical protein n=1 Tax=uncultured Campylobacter sp. TaxID=218934 RepID=UPI00262F81E9|nr:hypothetical protein [uncultured Campylobacter sp.]
MKLKFLSALILVVLLCGCSLLSQDGKETPFLADASRCDVASSLNKKQPNRCAKRQKIDAEVARKAQEQAVSQDTLNSFRANSAQAQQRAQQRYIATQQSLMQQQAQQQLGQMQQRQNMRNLQNEQNWNRLRNLENISSGGI